MSTHLAPLYDLLKKGATWEWRDKQKTAFKHVKGAILTSKFLAHFDPKIPLRLECDASAVGVGTVLSHRVNGIDYPIGFRSRTLNQAERNYSQLEKEALALVFGVTRFKDYLYGNKFVLVTDHKPLKGIFNPNKTIPPMAAARIQRWALLLDNYQCVLEYRKGTDNVNADALSRLPLQTSEESKGLQENPEYVLYTDFLTSKAIPAQDLIQLTNLDPTLQQVKQWIVQGWPNILGEYQQRYHP